MDLRYGIYVFEMHWHPRGVSTLNEELLGTKWKSMIGVRCDANHGTRRYKYEYKVLCDVNGDRSNRIRSSESGLG